MHTHARTHTCTHTHTRTHTHTEFIRQLPHQWTFRGCFWHLPVRTELPWTSLNRFPLWPFFPSNSQKLKCNSHSFLFRASTYPEFCVKWRCKQNHYCISVNSDYMGWHILVIIPGPQQRLTYITAIISSLMSDGDDYFFLLVMACSIRALKSRI